MKKPAVRRKRLTPKERARVDELFDRFSTLSDDPRTELHFTSPFTLVVAVALSAQATDVGVNKATAKLFPVASTPADMAALGVDGLIPYINSIGLFRNKAKNVIALSEIILRQHGGEVPLNREDLEALPGVLRTELFGGREEVMEVTIDPARMEAANVTAPELAAVIARNNQLVPAGNLQTQQGKFAVKVPGVVEDPADILALPIKRNGDRLITIGDIGEVHRTFKEPTRISRFNGQPAFGIDVIKRPGANILDSVKEVRRVAAEEEARTHREVRVLWPAPPPEALIADAVAQFGIIQVGGERERGRTTFHCPVSKIFPLSDWLVARGAGRVAVSAIDYVFTPQNGLADALFSKIA